MTLRNGTNKRRARELGLDFGGPVGALNAITDVPGVLVGYETLVAEPARAEALPVRTGVTAILPQGHGSVPRPIWAGQFSLNGNGEMTGSHWVRDGGYLVGPILITNTHSVGTAHQAAVRWMIEHYGDTWRANHLWAMPVVAETYDGVLNDINGLHVKEAHVRRAIDAAAADRPAEGNVGGGTGMICYEFKGGSGTASRRIEVDGRAFTLGAFVQANHGTRPWLKVLGVPVGRHLDHDRIPEMSAERGSIICIIGTDLPLVPGQLERLARRAAIGIGRGGTPGGNNSGDIFLAFSVANDMPLPQLDGPWRTFASLNDEYLDPVYLAAVEAIEESVVNALLAAEDAPTARPPGAICRALRAEELLAVLEQYGRVTPPG